jgi:hypothetical protein
MRASANIEVSISIEPLAATKIGNTTKTHRLPTRNLQRENHGGLKAASRTTYASFFARYSLNLSSRVKYTTFPLEKS